MTNLDESGSDSISRPAENASPKSAALRPARFIRKICKRPSAIGAASRSAVDNATRGSITPWQAMTRWKQEKSWGVVGNSAGQLSRSISNTHRLEPESDAGPALSANGEVGGEVMVSAAASP